MVSKRVRQIIEETARELGVPTKVVEQSLRGSFKFLADTMKKGDKETGDFGTVDIPGLGMFKTKPSWTAKINQRKEEYERKQQDGNK